MKLDEITAHVWDAVVVGAGPSGSLAARELARRSLYVLLVDQSFFPRSKVCGCCLSQPAVALLKEAGLGTLPTHLGAKPLHEMVLAMRGKLVRFPLPEGFALSREALDDALVKSAETEGVHFLSQTRAGVGPVYGGKRTVILRQGIREVEVQGRVVLAATGIGGTGMLPRGEFKVSMARHSRIGVSSICEKGPEFYSTGTIFMAYGEAGYVGLVRLEDGRLNIAAALDPKAVKRKGLAPLMKRILEQADFPLIPQFELLQWKGKTGLCSFTTPLAADRLFFLGDLAGYVEPFTGEGMAWAFASALAAVPLAVEAVSRQETFSLSRKWNKIYRELLAERQRLCRSIAFVLRMPWASRVFFEVISRKPDLIHPVIASINTPFELNR